MYIKGIHDLYDFDFHHSVNENYAPWMFKMYFAKTRLQAYIVPRPLIRIGTRGSVWMSTKTVERHLKSIDAE